MPVPHHPVQGHHDRSSAQVLWECSYCSREQMLPPRTGGRLSDGEPYLALTSTPVPRDVERVWSSCHRGAEALVDRRKIIKKR